VRSCKIGSFPKIRCTIDVVLYYLILMVSSNRSSYSRRTCSFSSHCNHVFIYCNMKNVKMKKVYLVLSFLSWNDGVQIWYLKKCNLWYLSIHIFITSCYCLSKAYTFFLLVRLLSLRNQVCFFFLSKKI
jgi:hypothetical protein